MVEITNMLNACDTSNEGTGSELCKRLGYKFNCLGSFSKMMTELNEALSETGKQYLQLLMCCAALSMVQAYTANEFRCFDDRKKASTLFAYQNREFFTKRFSELAGFTPEIVDPGMPYYPRAIKKAQWRERQDLLGFLARWADEHSTLKQAMFGGYVRGVLAQDAEIGTQAKEACFPFI